LVSMLGDGEVLGVGVGNLAFLGTSLSSTDGTVTLILFAIFALCQFGLIWFAR
jgi:hypothetical protein